ncbi:uncharacterized protein LOC100179644 [Ciona intestinalis]
MKAIHAPSSRRTSETVCRIHDPQRPASKREVMNKITHELECTEGSFVKSKPGSEKQTSRSDMNGFTRVKASQSPHKHQGVKGTYLIKPQPSKWGPGRTSSQQHRRKSIDCTYQILKLTGNSTRTNFDSSVRPPDAGDGLFPPLTNNKNLPEVRPPSNNNRLSVNFRERRLSDGNTSSVCWTRHERQQSPLYRNRQTTSRNRRDRSASIDCGYFESSLLLNGASNTGRKSPVQPTRHKYVMESSIKKAGLNVEQNHAVTNNAENKQNVSSSRDVVQPRLTEARFASSKLRAASVCSPTSAESGDKFSERLKFVAKRRRSVPIIQDSAQTSEVNQSPEFYQAYREMKAKFTNKNNLRNLPVSKTPSLRSTSSISSVKDVTSVRLGRIEEIPPEVQEEGGRLHENADEVEKDKQTLRNTNCQSTSTSNLAYVEVTSEKKVSDTARRMTFEIPELKYENADSRSRSSEDVPNNEDCVQRAASIVNGQPNTDPNNYFELFDDDDDVIEVELLDIPDDNLSDEDLLRKRIIIWLRDAQTGNTAEQRVRDVTPPPSPDPNRQTAIVVVYGENSGDK